MSPDRSKQSAQSDLFWLGIVGGGTNTRAALLDRTGRVRGEGRADAANFLRIGLANAVDNIRRATDAACGYAGIETAQIAGACIGLAGVGNPTHRRQMHEALDRALGIPQMTVEIDARIALAGATDLEQGVVIIAGTGSIAYGANQQGQYARAGGWGPVMGDEGSGHYIGRRALEAVVSAYDTRSQATSMTDAVCHHFGVSSPPDLPLVIYESPNRLSDEISALARIVVRAAREGDSAAKSIITEAAVELARAVVAVIERLGLQEQTFRVAYVGGVFEAGEIIIKPMTDAIRMVAPRAFVGPPLNSPVIGAARLALATYFEKEQLVR